MAEVLQDVVLIEKSTRKNRRLFKPFQIYGRFLGVNDGRLFFRTTGLNGVSCKNFCVQSIRFDQPSDVQMVVPQSDREVLAQASLISGRVVAQFFNSVNIRSKEFHSRVAVFDLKGQSLASFPIADQGLFPVGVLSNFTGGSESKSIYFNYSSFVDSPVVFRLDLGQLSLSRLNDPTKLFDASKVDIQLVRYRSRDGVEIPMHIFRRKDWAGPNQFAYLFFYGAIGVNNFAGFTTKFQMMLELGGVFAVAYVRGGGELGEDWIKAGAREKMKTFEDIAYASRFLRRNLDLVRDAEGAGRVIASGRSFGGWHVFVMRALFESDFSMFIPCVPIYDLERSIKNGNGWHLVDDVGFQRRSDGRVVFDESQFRTVRRFNPPEFLKSLKAKKPTIIFAGTRDTRTMPTQAYLGYIQLRKQLGEGAGVYLMSYENTGHLSRREGSSGDEVNFIANAFGIRELTELR